ncbi:MAG: dephospho-CoA kinase, partial [Deltaproteobacteria bacterium]|nr:dephospho-CoA kinase [Deltaproteobacteria bacterium]
ILALSGGIASGKSTVGDFFKSLGATILNADKEAKKLYTPGQTLYYKILKRYGSKLKTNTGIDRKKLASIIFNHKQEKTWLEKESHHQTRKNLGKKIRKALYQKSPLILVEAALHIETGYDLYFPGLILIVIPKEEQIKRLIKRDKLNLEEAKLRLRNQLSLQEKLKHAHWMIDNSGKWQETQRQIKKLYQHLTRYKLKKN